MEHAIVNIVESTKKSGVVDTSIFSSLISFLSFHKIYGIKRGVNTKFIIFFESGQSYYHKNISKTYKISRAIDDLYGLDKVDRDLFFSVLQSNFQLIEKACNKIPNLSVIRLSNMEADFVPYYLLTRIFEKESDKAYVIYSNDHDMWQTLDDDVYVFSKSAKNKKIVKSGKIISQLLKIDTDIEDKYFPLVMSVIGDSGDDVTGVKNIGGKRLVECFSQLLALTGDMDTIYQNVYSNKDIFTSIPPTIQNKHLKMIVDSELQNKTISKNLKLVSFELLSRFLENPKTTETLERRNEMMKILSEEKKIASPEAMKKALEMNKVFLDEASIDFLYL
jgi:5'-3' exonuclease